jgi:hypothetical protein
MKKVLAITISFLVLGFFATQIPGVSMVAQAAHMGGSMANMDCESQACRPMTPFACAAECVVSGVDVSPPAPFLTKSFALIFSLFLATFVGFIPAMLLRKRVPIGVFVKPDPIQLLTIMKRE